MWDFLKVTCKATYLLIYVSISEVPYSCKMGAEWRPTPLYADGFLSGNTLLLWISLAFVLFECHVDQSPYGSLEEWCLNGWHCLLSQ